MQVWPALDSHRDRASFAAIVVRGATLLQRGESRNSSSWKSFLHSLNAFVQEYSDAIAAYHASFKQSQQSGAVPPVVSGEVLSALSRVAEAVERQRVAMEEAAGRQLEAIERSCELQREQLREFRAFLARFKGPYVGSLSGRV